FIKEYCLSTLGEEKVDEMSFSTDFATVKRLLLQTDEFIKILNGDEEFPSSYFFDTRYSLKRIKPDGTWLDERELFDLSRSLRTISDITRFLTPQNEEEPPYPALTELAGDIKLFPRLVAKIDSIIDKYGKVKNNASPELQRIRAEMSSTMSGISKSLQSILRAAQAEGVVDKDI
ncbi:MutS2 family protein, partial [gut metagenome]